MKRNILKELVIWKTSPTRKPLIMLGARQVGKTYLLKQFGQEFFSHVLYINFEIEPAIHGLFQNSLDPCFIIKHLEIYYNKVIDAKNTLLIFDEIQECPQALISLKYFCENAPEYFIVSAGSLLGLKTKRSQGFPVGKVHFLPLYPLSFFEFLQAIDETQLVDYLQSINTIQPLPEPIHKRALEFFKIYLYIGGMPEVVKNYVTYKNLISIRDIQLAIIKAYEFDFAKHAPPELITRLTEVWHSLPKHLAKENKKFIFPVIRKGGRAREYDAAIQWLLDAKLIYRAVHILHPKLPLPAYSEHGAFKLYMNDVGLLGALSNLQNRVILEENKLFTEFKGSLTENFVANNLVTKKDGELFYWTSGNTAEVDSIVSHENQIYPLEVKSGSSTKKKSLYVYDERYHPELLHRTSPMNLKCDGRFCNYPLYLMERYPI